MKVIIPPIVKPVVMPKIPPVVKTKKVSIKQKKKDVKRKAGFLKSTKNGREVTQTELSEFLGVSTRTIMEWRDLGMPSTGAGKALRYDTAEAARWKTNFELEDLREQLTKDVDPNKMGIIEAKTRYEVAKALTAELHLAKEREQLVPTEYLMEKFGDALVEVRAKLVSMSSRLSGDLSHQEENEVGKILDIEVQDMLEVLSEYG